MDEGEQGSVPGRGERLRARVISEAADLAFALAGLALLFGLAPMAWKGADWGAAAGRVRSMLPMILGMTGGRWLREGWRAGRARRRQRPAA
ncbi:hypothetical protein [Actinacidiphila acididurans]|uniref:RDD family protein n=1 Tax=Actinacidiphila acididurans TaxID=2784346 RepID=A0ABS2U4V1_9ACTN|nr:hypothetical protein [Actinacidiphila acididurans]MBM9510624.1 hypothetical protein [Actinacidiphila acididurans]